MADRIALAIEVLNQTVRRRPISGPFDLFLVLTRIGIFPVPYFAFISCLMQRLSFNLMGSLHQRIISRYFVSNLPLSSRRYLGYLAEILVNMGNFSAASNLFSCMHPGFPRFPEYPPDGMPVSAAFLMVTTLYRMPIDMFDYARLLVDEDYNEALDTVLQFLMLALQSDAGITDSDLWFSISTLLIVLKYKMEENQKICSEYQFRVDSYGRNQIIPPEISDEEKSEIHALFWRLSVELKGLLQAFLRRPFFQRKLQRLSLLLCKFCPGISQSDLRIMSEALFESGFSDLSVIAWYEFLVSMDMANPIVQVSRFSELIRQECGSVSASINRELLSQLLEVSILMLQNCGITDHIYEVSLYAQKESPLENYILGCIRRKRIRELFEKK